MSVYSKRSRSTQPSRKARSDIDESLFGNNNLAASFSDGKKRDERIRVSKDGRRTNVSHVNPFIIPYSELMRMKNTAIALTKEEQLEHRKVLEEQTEKQRAAARLRKQRMLEMEEERKKNISPTEGEIEDRIKATTILSRAQHLLNEQKDEVKHMNQMTLYAKTVTIRDRQLEEKKEIYEQRKVEEKRKDLLMEIDRLKKIKYYEEIDNQRKEEQKTKALMIVDQIRARELERLKVQEDKEREGQEMLQVIKQLQNEEAHATLKKKNWQKKLNDEIYEENQRAAFAKQQRAQREKDEDDKIVRYNIEKAQREADYLAEQNKIKEEKEREVTRLRSLQEKAQDRQAEIDALRAKRASEKAERQARQREKEEAENRMRANEELFEARKMQTLEKEKRLQEQARQEREEFQKLIQAQKYDRDVELKAELQRNEMIKHHASQLKKQISLNEEKKKQEIRTYLEEGKKIRDKLDAEMKLLEEVKITKLRQLQQQGVPAKYQAELAKKRIVKFYMSINPEHYPLADSYHDFSGISPLYRANPSFHRFHSDPRRIRTPLHPHTAMSSHTDPYSLEHFNLKHFKSSLASSGAIQTTRAPVKLSDQLRSQQQKRRRLQNGITFQGELVSPIGVEPESSSSQPSEPFSGSYRDCSPYKIQGEALQNTKNSDILFPEALYVRANEFLDSEGLDLVDPQDYYYGKINFFSKPKEIKVSIECDQLNNGSGVLKDMRSLTQSPRILSNHISSSTLFQRRASRSQGPVGETGDENGVFASRRPGKLNTFRHFNDDVNQIMMAASPIEEKDTPVMSRNDSGYQGSTPNAFSSRKPFAKHLLSPDQMENIGSEENSLVNSLTKYKLSNSKKFKSPLLEIKPLQNFLEGSPVINLREEKIPSSLESSPTVQDPKSCKDGLQLRSGAVVRKSRFQKPEGL